MKNYCLKFGIAIIGVIIWGGVAFAGNPGFSEDHGILPEYVTPEPVDGTGKKLLVVYMVGSDLESEGEAGTSDFNEMIEGYNSLADRTKTDVVVAFGGANKNGWRGMKIADMDQINEDGQDGQYGNSGNYILVADNAHMGDESSLKFFLDYVKDRYTGYESRFIVFWDHGASYEGFGNDENFNNDGLSLTEISDAFQKSASKRFDMIGFDACLMASMETARYVHPYAGYMIASEELEPGHGWNWAVVIQAFDGNENVVDTGNRIVDSFVAKDHGTPLDGKTLSVVDLSRFTELLDAANAFADAFASDLSGQAVYSNSILQGTVNARDFGKQNKQDNRVSVDLKDLAKKTGAIISDTNAKKVIDALIAAVDNYVVYAREDGSRPNSFGVSAAPPEKRTESHKLSENWLAFQTAYNTMKSNDTSAPVTQEVDNDQDSSELAWENWDDWDDWDDSMRRAAADDESTQAPFLQGGRADLVKKESDGTVRGILATFDDENLTQVLDMYGFEDAPYEDSPNEKYFMVVAGLKSYQTRTTGQYFAPKWNKKWFIIQYGAGDKDDEWMPMYFVESFQDETGEIHTEYNAEIDYYEAGSTEPEFATLKVVTDASNTVVSHRVMTYKLLFDSPEDEEGRVQYDRGDNTIGKGDRVQFWTYGINLDDSEKDDWFETSDIITFEQIPGFYVDVLEFEDDKGELITYKHTMVAEDVNGNMEMTEPVEVAAGSNTDTTDTESSSDNGTCFIGVMGGGISGIFPVMIFLSASLLALSLRQFLKKRAFQNR